MDIKFKNQVFAVHAQLSQGSEWIMWFHVKTPHSIFEQKESQQSEVPCVCKW